MEKVMIKDRSLNMSADEFRRAGYDLVEKIGVFLEELPRKKITPGAGPSDIRALLPDKQLPRKGKDTRVVLEESADLLFEHSLFNSHPRFWGYITSSAAPIGALADLLASAVNANVGAFALSPIATEIERQTIQWLAELIGFTPNCGGIFVSGGNMANFLGFLVARRNQIGEDIRKEGLPNVMAEPVIRPWGFYETAKPAKGTKKQFPIYCAKSTHTWVQKAVDLFGHGTDSIRWIDLNRDHQMDISRLQAQIQSDRLAGHQPLMVIGNAGSVGAGTVDALSEIAAVCRTEGLWFHVDGAYGAPAAVLPEKAALFAGLAEADSIALDPHKWLYSPLEAGCILVRDPRHLHDTFNYHPEYYNFDGDGKDTPVNFHEYGMQNSRGFRALKVWLSLKQVGKTGLAKMIEKDIRLAEHLWYLAGQHAELETVSQSLSITTFRYVPLQLAERQQEQYLNTLNEQLLNRLQAGGEVFLSNAVIDGRYCLRVCIVNFRTTEKDLEALIEIVLREGRKLNAELQLHRPE